MTATEAVNSLGLELSIRRFPSEVALGTAYLLLNAEDLIPVIWHYRTPPTLSEFLELTKMRNAIYYVCYAKAIEGGNHEIAGLGWAVNLVPVGEREDRAYFRGDVGMAFLRKFSHGSIAVELATQCLDDAFMKCDVEILHGVTPVMNQAAIRFVGKLGFTKLGIAPLYTTFKGEPCDALLSYMTRSQWNQPREA